MKPDSSCNIAADVARAVLQTQPIKTLSWTADMDDTLVLTSEADMKASAVVSSLAKELLPKVSTRF